MPPARTQRTGRRPTQDGSDEFASHEYLRLDQDDDGVNARIQTPGGAEIVVRSHYLVGCDSGSSRVRNDLGIDDVGRAEIARYDTVFFRCDDLLEQAGLDPFRHIILVGGKRDFILIAQRPHGVAGEDPDIVNRPQPEHTTWLADQLEPKD